MANGEDPVVIEGQASFSTTENELTIINDPGTIINWQGFSINPDETTRFIQQNATSSVLNRVIGSDPSILLGSLLSNGRVFLINPAGIVVGQGARIDVAGLVASTLDLSNQNFLSGKFDFSADSVAADIDNQGTITTPDGGHVYLVGNNVSNSGLIKSPQGDVILAAGESVKIFDTATPGIRVEFTATDNVAVNLGVILAQSGEAGIYGASLRNAGIVNADQVVKDINGKIVLRAKQDLVVQSGSHLSVNGEQGGTILIQSDSGNTHLSGTVEAKGDLYTGGTVHALGEKEVLIENAYINVSGNTGGGEVFIGGNFHGKGPVLNARTSTIESSSIINADALTTGNGGRISVWSNNESIVNGTLTARGGANSGNGGFIETSAANLGIGTSTRVNTLAAHGNAGIWFIDLSGFFTLPNSFRMIAKVA